MKLLLIDGNSIINRAFYGIKLLSTKDGKYTNAVYGFLNILLNLEDNYSPDAIAVAWDLRTKTFRHAIYDQYKAGRKPMPPELAEQMPEVKDILEALGIRNITCETFEADDIIGTIAQKTDAETVYISTGDRDSFQLVNDRVTVLLASTKAGRPVLTEIDPAYILENYGVAPAAMLDIKALQGDSSDNIPGVAGIGPKTASDLIVKFGSLDKVYENIDDPSIRETLRARLLTDKDSAYMSYRLGKISDAVPIDTGAGSYMPSGSDPDKLIRLLSELELFKTLARIAPQAGKTVKKDPAAPEADSVTVVSGDNFDPEDIRRAKLLNISCCQTDGAISAFFIPSGGRIYAFLSSPFADEHVRSLLEDEDTAVCTTDIKALCADAAANGGRVAYPVFDVRLAAYLLNPNAKDYSAATICLDNKIPVPEIVPAEGSEAAAETYHDAILGAAVIDTVHRRMSAALETNGQLGLLTDIEIPLACVLALMERRGFRVDKDGIAAFGKKLLARAEELQNEIYELAGEEFNISSPKQLAVILFEKMGIKSGKKTKSGYSTNAQVLEALADDQPIVSKILEYRTLTKLYSTYCEGLVKAAGSDGRIHSTFNQTETRTGRLSSTEPNLQNIPVRTELGSEMRKFFIAKEGNVLVDADYSQIELRVLADIANDSNMIAAFNGGLDIHTQTASQVFGLPADMVTPIMRRRAKAVNFGIVYGIGAYSLAKNIGSTVYEAKNYISAYLHHYSGVNEYMNSIIEQAKKDGYVETLFHRRRYLPELSNSSAAVRAFGERVARNTPIQGTAADIIKIAMIKVENELASRGLKGRLIMTVHDELIVECPEDERDVVSEILRNEMENACKLKVLLSVDVHSGRSWYDAKG